MSIFQPQSFGEFKDFLDRNNSVVVVAAFNGDYASQQLLYELSTVIRNFELVRCVEIEVDNMNEFASEYGVSMSCIVYFNNGQKIHQNSSTDRSVIERDINQYFDD